MTATKLSETWSSLKVSAFCFQQHTPPSSHLCVHRASTHQNHAKSHKLSPPPLMGQGGCGIQSPAVMVHVTSPTALLNAACSWDLTPCLTAKQQLQQESCTSTGKVPREAPPEPTRKISQVISKWILCLGPVCGGPWTWFCSHFNSRKLLPLFGGRGNGKVKLFQANTASTYKCQIITFHFTYSLLITSRVLMWFAVITGFS